MSKFMEIYEPRVLAVISAICTSGFTTQWHDANRGFQVRESFFFDSSARMQAMTGDKITFVMQIDSRKGDDGKTMGASPSPCDWELNDLIEWIHYLDERDFADLPEADMSLEPVKLMSQILGTIDTDNRVKAGISEYSAHFLGPDEEDYRSSDYEGPPVGIETHGHQMMDGKWDLENFLLLGRE